MKPSILQLSLAMLVGLISACDSNTRTEAEAGRQAASASTRAANAALGAQLDLAAEPDLADATRGFVATVEGLQVTNDAGQTIWRTADYDFVRGDAPDTVNPSLWRQARLNNVNGLFRITERIYQVRGFDLANMTVIEGDQGRIIVDPLTTFETATAALALVEQTLGQRPISAVIFTHSHLDHFGGVQAVLRAGETPRIIAPAGFMEEAISENLLAGTAMIRRAAYMYGLSLPRDAKGHVDTGLGKQPALGRFGIAEPTDLITSTGQQMSVDGVQFEFQLVSGSEAPAELTFYLPQFRVWCGAEMVSRNMHNLYTLRGAKVRDALQWSAYIQEAIDRYAARTDILINSHHWPVWQDVAGYLAGQRDIYKYIHDQTLRLANQGATPSEIAEQLTLPDSLATRFANRGYYGTVSHNAKAVYQFYFGWYDGNPVNLNPLPPTARAERYAAALGGTGKILSLAQLAYDEGDYRWAAELLNHLVFAEPDNADARAALANSYEQLGYQAESGPWRDIYLSGAHELRQGVTPTAVQPDNRGIVKHIALPQFFAVLATLLDGPAAADVQLTINLHFTDLDQRHLLWIENAVLHHREGQADGADVSLTLTSALWLKMLQQQASLTDLFGAELQLDGSKLDLVKFLRLLDQPDPGFAIVTPE